MHILTFNAGSSSLKFQLTDTESEQAIARGKVDWSGPIARYTFAAEESNSIADETAPADIRGAIQRAFTDIHNVTVAKIVAIAHRVVHGGTQFVAPTLITESVVESLGELVALSPLHNRHSLQGIKSAAV